MSSSIRLFYPDIFSALAHDPVGSSANAKPKVDKTHLQSEVIYKVWPAFQTGGHTCPRVLTGLHAYHSQ
jgi:hypothetical protein